MAERSRFFSLLFCCVHLQVTRWNCHFVRTGCIYHYVIDTNIGSAERQRRRRQTNNNMEKYVLTIYINSDELATAVRLMRVRARTPQNPAPSPVERSHIKPNRSINQLHICLLFLRVFSFDSHGNGAVTVFFYGFVRSLDNKICTKPVRT